MSTEYTYQVFLDGDWLQSRNAANSFSIVRIDVYFLYNLHCCVLRVCRYVMIYAFLQHHHHCDMGYCNFGISPKRQINQKNSWLHSILLSYILILQPNFSYSFYPCSTNYFNVLEGGLIPSNFFLIQDYQHHASALQLLSDEGFASVVLI